MSFEHERKFLIPDMGAVPISRDGVRMEQYYLDTPVDGWAIRARNADGAYTLTLKRGDGLTRDELETPVSEEFFKSFVEKSVYGVSKIRYLADGPDGTVWEVDDFGDHQMAELELPHPDQEFVKPHWVEREVTDDNRYTNLAIAKFGFPIA